VCRPLGAREEQAHRVEREVLDRFRVVSHRAHKAMTPHSRQEWERELAGERGMRIAGVAFALDGLTAEDRAWVLEPLLQAEPTPTQHVLQELAEANEAVGSALGSVQRLLAGGSCTPNAIQKINAEFHAAARELADVPRALEGRS